MYVQNMQTILGIAADLLLHIVIFNITYVIFNSILLDTTDFSLENSGGPDPSLPSAKPLLWLKIQNTLMQQELDLRCSEHCWGEPENKCVIADDRFNVIVVQLTNNKTLTSSACIKYMF